HALAGIPPAVEHPQHQPDQTGHRGAERDGRQEAKPLAIVVDVDRGGIAPDLLQLFGRLVHLRCWWMLYIGTLTGSPTSRDELRVAKPRCARRDITTARARRNPKPRSKSRDQGEGGHQGDAAPAPRSLAARSGARPVDHRRPGGTVSRRRLRAGPGV